MTLEQLKEWVMETIKNHPHLKSEIIDHYELCVDEIENGESEYHEIDLCIGSVEQLIEGL